MGNSQSDRNDTFPSAQQSRRRKSTVESEILSVPVLPSQRTGATMNFDLEEIWKPDSVDTDTEAKATKDSSIHGDTGNRWTLRLIHGGDIFNITEIGEGMFGKAFKGTFEGRENKSFTVAVKVLRVSTLLSLEEGSEKMSQLMGLRHQNIATILGVIVDNFNSLLADPKGGPRIVLQYFNEGNVLNYLSKKENPQDYAMLGKLALDVINGCQYLHSQDIIHGNLAARNILIQKCVSPHKPLPHYNAIVSDYGISQFSMSASAISNEKDFNLECIRWMPKELAIQIKEDVQTEPNFTKKSDVWSFGVVLWEMWMKGAVPFGSSKIDRVYKFLVNEGRSPLSLQRPKGLPEHILFVMESIFNVDPTQRPAFDTLNQTFNSFKKHYLEKKRQEAGSKKSTQTPKKPKEKIKKEENDHGTSKAKSEPIAPEATLPNTGTQGKKKNKPPPPPQNQAKQPDKASGHGGPRKSSGPPPPPYVPAGVGIGHVPPPPAFGSVGMGPIPTPVPPQPPPYTSTPLSSFFQGSPGNMQGVPPPSAYPTTNLETEIQRRERELEALRTQQLQAQFLQKQAEMDAIVKQLAQQNLNSVFGTSPESLGAGAPPPVYQKGPYAQKGESRKPRPRNPHKQRGRSKSRSRGNRDDDASRGNGGTCI